MDPAAEMEFQELQQDMRNAAMLQVVSEGFKELQQEIDDRRRRIEPGYCGSHPEQRTAGVSADGRGRRRARPQAEEQGNVSALDAGHQELQQDGDSTGQRMEQIGADAEQAAEAEQMWLQSRMQEQMRRGYRETQRSTQHSGSTRQQQMASQVTVAQHPAAPGYYGPQPGQMAAGLTADGSRQEWAPPQVVAGSKLAKARQNMAGVETGGSRVEKSRRTSDLSVERHELGHILVGAAMHQAERWIQQWDSIQSTNRMSTPACSNEEKWRQGIWARHQLMNNGMSVWREEEWVGLLEQQYGFGYASLTKSRVVP